MLRNSFLLFLMFLISLTNVFGQYGNEWINFDQPYFKLKVAEDGLYRVTAAELQAVGFQPDIVAADRLRLFHNGEEVAISVSSSAGRLNHFEFYGQRNDGTLDNELYVSPEAQPHDLYSLFADSSTYFLTYELTGGSGSRMVFSTDNNTAGLSSESFHLQEEVQLFTNSYASGLAFGTNSRFSLSQYDFGEGWTGGAVSKGNSQDISFLLENVNNSGPSPELEMVLIGGNGLNHRIEIFVGPNESSLRSLGTQTFSDRTSFLFNLDMDFADISATGELLVRMTVVGFDGASDRVSISYASVTFPQSFLLNQGETNTFQLVPNSNNRSLIEVASDDPGGLRFFDVSDPVNPIRLTSSSDGSQAAVIVNNTSISRRIIGLSTAGTVPDIEAYEFNEIDLSSANYLVISHPNLRSATTSGDTDPVESYGVYRASEEGGGWSVEIANIQDVYDQFLYGIPSPLSIRRLMQFGYEEGDLELAFLIGKGLTVNFDAYRNGSAGQLVPTYGLPGSDMLFTTGFQSDPLLPAIGIGRITATNPDDVQAYLNKVIESEATPYEDLWRKDILQLTGGQNAGELSTFRAHAEDFANVAEGDFIGARVRSLSKQTAATSEFINIREEVDAGLSMITFFGHSGPAVTDIEVDRPEVFENDGRYPSMFLVNGCNAGDIFGNFESFGEPWILTPNKGSTGFIANVTLATSSRLKRFTDLFYATSFEDTTTLGTSIGEIMNIVAERFFEISNSNGDQSQVYQMVFQGDPATKVFAAEFPDYAIESSNVSAEPILGSRILASQDSFRLELIIPNFGRTSQDSLDVLVTHTLPSGEVVNYDRRFSRILYQDTLSVFVPNNVGDLIAGNNLLQITLDPDNLIEEINESNNSVSLDVFISNGSTFPLLPLENAVVTSAGVRFVWQVLGAGFNELSYEFEIDTIQDFNSPFLIRSMESGSIFVEREVSLNSLPDSTVVYWRTRLADTEEDADSLWSTSRFTIIRDGGAQGWGAFTPDQFEDFTITGINYNEALRQWEFDQTSSSINIKTHGPNNAELDYFDIEVDVQGVDLITTNNIPDPVCRDNTINAVVFSTQTSNAYLPIEFSTLDIENTLVCGRQPQLIHNFSENNVLGADRWLEQLIDAMQNGDQIVLFTIDSVAFSQWDDPLKAKLEEIGVSVSIVDGLTDGQPIIFFGEKGTSAGSARMITTDNSGRDPKEQVLQFVGESDGAFTSGSIRSQIIGPAVSWQGLDFQLGDETDDNVSFDVIGIAPGGNEEPLFAGGRVENIDLSTVDPNQYPNIRLDFNFSDNSSSTPPQVGFWHVRYQHPPDGILLMPDQSILSLQEGDSVNRELFFYNYTDQSFEDSVQFTSQLVNTENGSIIDFSFNSSAPLSGDSSRYLFNASTLGRVGSFNFTVRANPEEQELYATNNNLTRSNFLTVESDNINPVLDVTFDGAYILNGDIISPNPLINILLKDQNSVLLKTDTTGIAIALRTGDDGDFVPVSFSGPELNFTPASEEEDFNIEYRPGPLEDGRYALRVQASDESGNPAGAEPYEITFEVVNESSITYFYPYPNPFSTSTRFVFTLTGSEVPDQLKIQIMTISGRVVREILQDEIGPMKIGNNITQYAWDGRDEFGDQLANGVYLYRVIARINGEDIKNRGTAADQAFKNGFGKLYILR